jgi:DNA damage-binding protein 1
MGDGLLFVGSHFGDSQLIRLHPDAGDGQLLSVQHTLESLAPITDFCLLDFDKQQGSLVACCGANQQGSLKIVRNGIGIATVASMEMEQLNRVWSLKASDTADNHTHLVCGFTYQTRILSMNEGMLQENEAVSGFELGCPTLECANMQGGLIAQVSRDKVSLMNAATLDRVGGWTPTAAITQAGLSSTAIVVGLAGGKVVTLRVAGTSLVVESYFT